jgi:hypothetical protein
MIRTYFHGDDMGLMWSCEKKIRRTKGGLGMILWYCKLDCVGKRIFSKGRKSVCDVR